MAKLAEFSTRGSKTGQTQRMRVYSLHDDQIEVITAALKIARIKSETEFDSVALTNICLHFLTMYAGDPACGTPASASEEYDDDHTTFIPG